MTEPDFERLADVYLARLYEVRRDGLLSEHGVLVEALRHVWNARGSADAIVVAGDLDYVDAIKALDR